TCGCKHKPILLNLTSFSSATRGEKETTLPGSHNTARRQAQRHAGLACATMTETLKGFYHRPSFGDATLTGLMRDVAHRDRGWRLRLTVGFDMERLQRAQGRVYRGSYHL